MQAWCTGFRVQDTSPHPCLPGCERENTPMTTSPLISTLYPPTVREWTVREWNYLKINGNISNGSNSASSSTYHSRISPPRVPLKHFHSLENTTVECLKSSYHHPSIIYQTIIGMILEALPLKDSSSKELRRLHDVVQQHLRALDYKPSGPFITSVLELKLDVNTMFEWQKHS